MSEVTAAGSLLLGLEAGPGSIRSSTLAAVLSQRLTSFIESTPPVDTLPPDAGADEAALKHMTAHYATLLLSHAAAAAKLAAQTPTPSTSSATAPPPPRYGSRDSKVIGMLAGVVGRWGIAARVQDGVLPASVKERTKGAPAPASGRFTDITEDDYRSEGLEEVVRAVLGAVLLGKGVHRDSGAGQLAAIILPQLMLPLVGALVQLAYKDPQAGAWAQESLTRLLRMCVTMLERKSVV